MYYDFLYILPALILSLWASARVKSTYARYREVRNARGITGAQIARQILDENGLQHVALEQVAGELSDHFDPSSGTVRLSADVYGGNSVAALGVAAHECGHAIQYARGYTPIRVRAAIIPVTGFASQFAMPMVFLGILLAAYAETLLAVAYAGIILFGFCVLFQLVTLPVEFNASRRAMGVLEQVLTPEEAKGAKQVLSAAAMTYVAALASSLLQLLRLLSIVGRNQRRR